MALRSAPFCFLFVLCCCRWRRQARDQRSWNCALKILPVPLGGHWAEIKIKPFCWCPFNVAEGLISEEFLFKNLRLEVFKNITRKLKQNQTCVATSSFFFFLKLQVCTGHFKNYDLMKDLLGPWNPVSDFSETFAGSRAVGLSSASLALRASFNMPEQTA